MSSEPDHPRVERPRFEPEIISPGEGVKRMSLKRPGPFTIVMVLLSAGPLVAGSRSRSG